MKKSDKTISSHPRLISRCVLSALALLASANAAANAEFANVPLYLQNETKSSEVNVKPNVMLLIDDSGSMKEIVPNSKPSQSRLDITKDALKKVLNNHKDTMNWAFQTLNNSVNMNGYTDGKTKNYTHVINHVNRLGASGGTPTTRRYFEVSNLVRNQPKYRCEKNYIVLMSDGDANLSCDWNNRSIRDSRFAGDRTRYTSYTTFTYKTDSDFPAQAAGSCARDNSGPYDTFWDSKEGLKFLSNVLFEKDFKTGGKDAAGKSWNGEDDTGEFKTRYQKQNIETFTVGFGSGLTARGNDYLSHGAATSLEQGYFKADDANQLLSSFNKIIQSIAAANAPIPIEGKGSAAPALTNPGQSTSAAMVKVDTGTWSSRLEFYPINEDGSVNTNPSAVKVPSFNNRQTILNDGVNNHLVGSIQSKDINNDYFGIRGGSPVDEFEWRDTLLKWTARHDSDENLKTIAKSKKYNLDYRVREIALPEKDKRNLGDILDSSVHTIGDQVNQRNEFLVTAANDGMVHLFQSASGDNPYDLKVSYIPAGMERDDDAGNSTTMGKYLKDLADEKYGKSIPHRYMVNGGIVLRRTAKSSNEKITGQRIFLFGSMGQGGRGAYALNVAGQDRSDGSSVGLNSSVLSDVPMFETKKGAENQLGYTIGTPQIGRVSLERENLNPISIKENVRYAGFLASGYRVKGTVEGKPNETALYIYDMLGQEADSGQRVSEEGELIRKIIVPGGVGGLSSPTLVDTNFDGIVDVAYAGDYGGNMYRFDLRGNDSSQWTATRIYQGDASQPITSAPAISRRSDNKYVVIFGTGSDIYQSDRDNTDQQAIYGIFDDLNKDAADAKSGELLLQTLSSDRVTIPDPADNTKTIETDAYKLSNNRIVKEKGWKINLNADGERVVVKPTMILRTAVITTRTYKVKTETSNKGRVDVCIPEVTTTGVSSSTMLLGVNAETGGQPNKRDGQVQFIKDNVTSQDYYAGLRQTGIVSFTYLDMGKKDDSPVTRDGDSGGSGTDLPVSDGGGAPNNKCFSREAVRVLLANNNASFPVDGRICGIRRLSWREIFF